VSTLTEKINASAQLAELPLDPTSAEQVGVMSPVLATPAAIAAGVAVTGAVAGAVGAGVAVGQAID
jgi:hypothetical protein